MGVGSHTILSIQSETIILDKTQLIAKRIILSFHLTYSLSWNSLLTIFKVLWNVRKTYPFVCLLYLMKWPRLPSSTDEHRLSRISYLLVASSHGLTFGYPVWTLESIPRPTSETSALLKPRSETQLMTRSSPWLPNRLTNPISNTHRF